MYLRFQSYSVSEVLFSMLQCGRHRQSELGSFRGWDPNQLGLLSKRIVSRVRCEIWLPRRATPPPSGLPPKLPRKGHPGPLRCGQPYPPGSPRKILVSRIVPHIDPGRPAWKDRIKLEAQKPFDLLTFFPRQLQGFFAWRRQQRDPVKGLDALRSQGQGPPEYRWANTRRYRQGSEARIGQWR